MSEAGARRSLSQVWQIPLLALSLGAFGVAVYLFSYPGPGATIQDKINAARDYLKKEQPENSITILNAILEKDKPTTEEQGKIHLMLAESLEVGQRLKHISIPDNHAAIINQTKKAIDLKVKLKGADYQRMGDSYEALDKRNSAIEAYKKAIEADASLAVPLEKKITQLQISANDVDSSAAGLAAFLEHKTLTDQDRGWALGEQAEQLIAKGKYAEAKELLGQILTLKVDNATRGHTAYRYGMCAIELKEPDEAERQFRLARDLLTVSSPIDAEAAYQLGKIELGRKNLDQAIALFDQIIVSHPGSRPYLMSRIYRGIARLSKGEDDAGLSDLAWGSQQMEQEKFKEQFTAPVIEAFQRAEGILSARQNYQGALEVLGQERLLQEKPPASFWGRVTIVYERRADQVEAAAKKVEGNDEKEQLLAAARQLRSKAGDACFSYSLALTAIDNEGYGRALWHAMELYDRAGAVDLLIRALELFTQEKPSDLLAPEATLRLGRAYMTVGQFDKAIATFQRNQFLYPNSYASNQSAVPLAQSLVAKGAPHWDKAEKVLLTVVDNNPALTPQATEFRNALFELAQLYYRQGRYEESIARFDEVLKRYPEEERLPQILFLMADGYRKSAAMLVGGDEGKEATQAGAKVRPSIGSGADLSEAEAARKHRLTQARGLFDKVISYYRDKPPRRDMDKTQQRLAHFYRADCTYDLGLFEDAIKLYDQAAFRYQDDASALAAYVQIVNANVALGRPAEARSANERAKWLLRRMPAKAFTDGSFSLSRAYWEQWLKWSGETGLWSQEGKAPSASASGN